MQAAAAGLSPVRVPLWPLTSGCARTLELFHPSATKYQPALLDSSHLLCRPAERLPWDSCRLNKRVFGRPSASHHSPHGNCGTLHLIRRQ
jgi:hypothetical protein